MENNHPVENLITSLYARALALFPTSYRREYGDELLYAVRRAAEDANAEGLMSLIGFTWRELRDLPVAVCRAHQQEWSQTMNQQPGMRSPGSSLRLWQIGAIFLPYLLVSLLPLRGWAFTNEFPWLISVAGIPLLGLLAVIWIFGLAREFPVWAMPALGIILYLVSAFFHLITQFGLYFAIYKPLSGGMGWIGGMSLASIGTTVLVQLLFLFIVVGLILGLMRIVPRFQARVREEWTLLSFLLFGMAIVPITFAGDEFDSVGWHQIASLTTLVISAGLYLIASQRWQRVFVLVAAVVLAPAIMSLGLYQVFPAQSWVNEVEPNSRIWEALQPVFSLSTMPLLLLLPALIPRMPWFGSPATSHSIESHS